MPEEQKSYRIQINMEVDADLFEMHNKLCFENEQTSAQLFRWLIRQEYARRFSQPNPLVTVEEATEAGQ